jgi:hypothetical protein
MQKTLISRESLEAIGFIFDQEMYDFFIKGNLERISFYSPCKRFIVTKCLDGNNISYQNAWGLHIDNSDMQSLASCDVEFIEQIQALMEIYKDY